VNQAGNDTLDGGAGADELVGRAGNDTCSAEITTAEVIYIKRLILHRMVLGNGKKTFIR